ncbi:MAG TPA: fatty acid desaturase [Sorangium sp.]|nr:fatty acid desaturase [Sorangium sp.]
MPFVFGAFLASLTSMIEHDEMLPGEDAYSSRSYGTGAHMTDFLWNNVTYHNEHHKFPSIPWYNLRSFHEVAYPHYDEKVKAFELSFVVTREAMARWSDSRWPDGRMT